MCVCMPSPLLLLLGLSLTDALLLAQRSGAEVIIHGRRVSASDAVLANAGQCIEPIDPVAGGAAFFAAAALAAVGFNTQRNRDDSLREGGNVPRRRALTWLGLQTGAAFCVGPQLTNPCSNVNSLE